MVGIFRVSIEPTARNGLLKRSQIMVDNSHTQPKTRIGVVIGAIDVETMANVDRVLAVFLGIA